MGRYYTDQDPETFREDGIAWGGNATVDAENFSLKRAVMAIYPSDSQERAPRLDGNFGFL